MKMRFLLDFLDLPDLELAPLLDLDDLEPDLDLDLYLSYIEGNKTFQG